MKRVRRMTIFRSSVLVGAMLLIAAAISLLALAEGEATARIFARNGFALFWSVSLGVFVYAFYRPVLKSMNKLLLYVSVILIMVIPSFALATTEFVWLMPYATSALIVAIMLDENLGMTTHIFIMLLIAVIGGLNTHFIAFTVFSGCFTIHLIAKVKERQRIFYGSIYVMMFNILLGILLQLMATGIWQLTSGRYILFISLSAVLAIVLATGSLPLWETLFNITTPYKLLELTNASQTLLKRLMLEAPGTYHHSQMVANLAETAALDMNANALLARTGALYHDIGKLKKPGYFIENQSGINPHDELAPDSSAQIIIAHVDDGVRLAQEHKLPEQIIDIIRQHQGNAILKYFFDKAQKNSDGYAIDLKAFSYNGPRPITNEAAIVMLADCVEAYVRSNPERNTTLEGIRAMIDEMILLRFKEGQLDKSDLKISDLPLIAEAFLKVYNGMFHERIKYVKE